VFCLSSVSHGAYVRKSVIHGSVDPEDYSLVSRYESWLQVPVKSLLEYMNAKHGLATVAQILLLGGFVDRDLMQLVPGLLLL